MSDSRERGRAVAEVLELLGRRWQLRIIWELGSDTLSFRELQGRCDDISPSTLATRLAELREAGIVGQEGGYRLTAAGSELLDLYPPIADWAHRRLRV